MKARWFKSLSISVLCMMTLLTAGCQETENTPLAVVEEIDQPVRSGEKLVVEGEIVPHRYAYLSFSTPGTIQDIWAEEGDVVEKGQTLARLEGSESIESAIAAAELEWLAAQQDYQALFDNADMNKAQAQLNLAQAELALEKAEDNMKSKRLKKGDEQDIQAAYADYILALEEIEDAEEDFEEFADKPDTYWGKANALKKLAQARQRRDDAIERWDDLRSMPDALDVSEAEAGLEAARAKLQIARQDWDDLQDGFDEDDVEYAEARLKNARSQMTSSQQTLNDLDLISPFDGVIIKSSLKTGELASPQQYSVIIIDDSYWLVETTDVTELDIINIETGMPAVITLDAIPGLEINGEVSKIKKYGINKQGDITYTVTLTLHEQDNRLRWKMSADVIFK